MSIPANDPRTGPLPAPSSGRVDVLILAGEHSGDQHAARALRELHALRPELHVCALGGPELDRAGAEVLHNLVDHSVVGLVEVLKNFAYFRALFRRTVEWIRQYRPAVVCLVDYPGFNLRLAEALKKAGISRQGGGQTAVYMYVSPQIWAWKAGRRFKMARLIDELGVIFPFEVDCYRDTTLPVRFVGHPFAASDHCPSVHYDPAGPILLLPGSRRQPIQRILPILLAGWEASLRQHPNRRAVILYPETGLRDLAASILESFPLAQGQTELRPATSALGASAVLTSSGTMSLSCALAGLPGAIVYRAHPVTYYLARLLVKIEHLGIANLLLQPPIYPEYLQGDTRPEQLAAELHSALNDPQRAQASAAAAHKLHALLSAPSGDTVATRLLAWMDPVTR